MIINELEGRKREFSLRYDKNQDLGGSGFGIRVGEIKRKRCWERKLNENNGGDGHGNENKQTNKTKITVIIMFTVL